MSVAPARHVALRALGRIRRDEAFSGAVVSAELRQGGSLAAEDAALATRLIYGTLAAEGVLDDVIDRYARGGLEPRLRDVLRLAAFELLFGAAPAYAVADQAVDAARRVRAPAAGLANAVVRRIAEAAASFPWGDPETDRDALARLTGHPRWIVDLALTDLGERAGREMLACGMEPAPTYIRLDPFAQRPESTLQQLSPAGPSASPPDPDCFVLDRPAAAFSGDTSEGWFAMDAAAQVAPAACRPCPGERVLDAGAGRGNKTVCLQAIAVRGGGPADITAVDVHPGKIAGLQARIESSGVPEVSSFAADVLETGSLLKSETFDAVLLDAPCSGLGTLRRYPEKRWRLAQEAPRRVAETQLELLTAVGRLVRPGGRLVYSTCTVARVENDGVVDAFLESAEGTFESEPVGDVVPAEWDAFRWPGGRFQSWPTSGGPDGHYVAVIRRRGV